MRLLFNFQDYEDSNYMRFDLPTEAVNAFVAIAGKENFIASEGQFLVGRRRSAKRWLTMQLRPVTKFSVAQETAEYNKEKAMWKDLMRKGTGISASGMPSRSQLYTLEGWIAEARRRNSANKRFNKRVQKAIDLL